MFVVLLCFHTMLAGNSRTKQNIRLSQDWKTAQGKMKGHFWLIQ